MSDIEQITGGEHKRAITLASRPYVAWLDGTAARFTVIGPPQLVIFKGGKKIVHQIGTAALPGLVLWANPHLAGLMIAVSWSDCVWQSAIGR
ncbi:hypothetical protein [Acidisphaera sp. S103]|uniref:hypothetical protein n=1 Tax=Acidisphaera sp. S103 TaxID=1747223 RepID=UPI00131BEF37|nr:hypothetical protein [Acidisphaera sp. S103]